MAKCANCVSDALFVYTITNDFKIYYCQYHLPRALGKGKVAGVSLLPIEVVAPKAAKKKVVEPETVVVEEPTVVVEEPVEEVAPTEE